MGRLRHIAIVLPLYPSMTPRLLAGVRSYYPQPGQAAFHLFTTTSPQEPIPWAEDHFDGALVHASQMPHALDAWRLPKVGIISCQPAQADGAILEDHHAIGRLAGDYLLGRNFTHLAVVQSHNAYSADREAGFRERMAEAGLPVHAYQSPADEKRPSVLAQLMGRWLLGLPKPVAVFAVNDSLGTQVIGACREHGLDVPGQVAVLGAGDAAELCCLSWPTLSSIAIPYERIGYEAASQLDRLISAGRGSGTVLHIPPLGVTTRQSTLHHVSEDPVVSRAMRFIMDHACRPISAQDVADHAGYSYRRLLERFRASMGTGIHQEIRKVQMSHAKRLLSETSMPIHKVARQVGWTDGKEITRIFRRELDMTPAIFRQRNRQQ